MTDYRNESQRLVNLGLNLRNDPDKVDQGFYTRLTNIRSPREGSLTTRLGRTESYDTGLSSVVHTIKRLDDSTFLFGVGTALYRNVTAYSTGGYSGNPLSIVISRPALPSEAWAYVGDENQLRKVRSDGLDYKWGITAPTSAAAAAAYGSGNLDSSVAGGIVYDWRYTYYSSNTGAESNPSPTMTGIAVVSQRARVSVVASTDTQVDTIRLYRRGGSQPDSWNLTATSTNTSQDIDDNNSDASIALATQLETDSYVPFTSIDAGGDAAYEVPLPYVWGPFLGKYILACGDSNRPGYVYWTNSNRPDTSDTANNTPVTPPTEELMGGFIYSSTPFVWSSENLYSLDYGGPSATPKFVPRKTPVGRGLSAPWAYCIGTHVWFLSKDGIYVTDTQSPAVSITEDKISPIFHGVTVEDVPAIDYSAPEALRLSYADLKLHFLYKGIDATYRHLTFHTLYDRWEQESVGPFNERVVYQDEKVPSTDIYVGSQAGKVYEVAGTTDDGTAITCSVRTGSRDFELPQTLKEYGNAIFDVDPNGGDITVTPYLNAETSTLSATTLSGTGRQKIPFTLVDTYAYSMAFDLSWTGTKTVYQYEYLWRPEEELIKHWEFPPTSHGMQGWQHVRDMYVAIRSTADVTLTVVIDGTSNTYTLPSTSGERRKLHVWLGPYKGKMFQYKLDSSASFRLYGEDCEVHVKGWNTGLGYKLISPFIQESGGT